MRYRPELDGMRALAVLAVIASHVGLAYSAGGWMGVDIFFVLSGYLITSLLLSEQSRFGSISLGKFYSRRILRLYPALITVIVVGVIFFPVLATPGTLQRYAEGAAIAGFYLSDFAAGFGHITALGGFGATWSLAVEEHFYLLWPPALILLVRFRRNLLGWTALAAGLSLATLVVLSFVWPPGGFVNAAYYLPWSRFWTLLLGCVVAIVLQRGARIHVLERASVGVALAVGIGALVLVAAHFPRNGNFAWESPAIGVLTAALVWHLVTAQRSVPRALLSLKPLVWIGRRSYGIYLYHVPVMLLIELDVLPHFPMRRIMIALVIYAATIGVAAVSYRFLELPFLRLKKRFSAGNQAPLATADAVTTPAPTTGAV